MCVCVGWVGGGGCGCGWCGVWGGVWGDGGGGGAWRTPLAHDLLQLHTDCKLIVGLIMKVCVTVHSTSSTSDEIHIFFKQQFWLNDEIHIFFKQQFWLNREYESGNQVHVVKIDFIHYNDVIMRAMVPNHQPQEFLLNRLFRCRSKKTSKPRVTGLCAGNSPATGEFPAQKASSAENGSIWWHHHVLREFLRHRVYHLSFDYIILFSS